jgi:hypothetical protein
VELWEVVQKRGIGRPVAFRDADELAQACENYFKWVQENPLLEQKAFAYEGSITKTDLKKCHAFTVEGLCLFIGITRETWNQYRKKPEFSDVTNECDEIIRNQKFTAAAAGLLNPVIIARDLGLREITDHLSSDGSMTPKAATNFDVAKLSDQALAELMAARRPSP